MGNIGNIPSDEYQTILKLKEILENRLTIDEFMKNLENIDKIQKKYKTSFISYINKNISLNDEKLIDEFFRYCLILSSSRSMVSLPSEYLNLANASENIFNFNKLGPICFITPEIGEQGKWNSVGGIGIMVDELTQGLTSLGQEIIIISPYYNVNKEGNSNFLSNDPLNIHHIRNVSINLDEKYEFGIHFGEGNNGIKYYFLHNVNLFPKPYPNFEPKMAIKSISCFAKASLQLLCDLNIIPSIIVTNDWFCGLTPAYSKNGSFGETFQGTIFLHICHNLEQAYEGRIYPSKEEGNLENIYQFDPNWIIDFSWDTIIINPSRCAIKLSDQWATVSHSYKNDLLNSSPLKSLLAEKKSPFSFPNGISKEKRINFLNACGLSREECKKYIQKKYFKYDNMDISVPIFSFIGRITEQKGVKLILEAAEEMINFTNGKINILVGGTGDKTDPYVDYCIKKINYLKEKYPYSFWADPNQYFEDGLKINKGSDFALMPSLFEPGGIVQHEFFIAGTPVIAFRTGGLKDSVFEFNYENNTGNGFTFDGHNSNELISAMKRAIDLFKNNEKYEICRKNAYNGVIDVAEVSKAWCKEFYRLKNKIYFNVKEVQNTPVNNIIVKFDNEDKNLASVTFMYKIYFRVPKEVFICGEFDNWRKNPLYYNGDLGKWTCTLKIKKGKYCYKFIVDGNWEINHNEMSICESNGFVNNLIFV